MTEQQSGSPSKEGMSRHTMDLSHTLNCDYLIVTLHNSFPGLNAIMFVMGHFMDTCLGFQQLLTCFQLKCLGGSVLLQS